MKKLNGTPGTTTPTNHTAKTALVGDDLPGVPFFIRGNTVDILQFCGRCEKLTIKFYHGIRTIFRLRR